MDRQIYLFPTITGQAYQKHYRHLPCAVHESDNAFFTDNSDFSSKLTYRDCLQYLLYGSMVYMALKQWSKAQHCLSMVIASPVTNSVSKIMVEAYKKWILVSLLGHGRVISATLSLNKCRRLTSWFISYGRSLGSLRPMLREYTNLWPNRMHPLLKHLSGATTVDLLLRLKSPNPSGAW